MGMIGIEGPKECNEQTACAPLAAAINSGGIVLQPEGNSFVSTIQINDRIRVEFFYCPWCGYRINKRPKFGIETGDKTHVGIN